MAGVIFHVINRGARRGRLFEKSADYDAFMRVLRQALERHPIRLLNFCVMPTHLHLVVWPEKDAQLPKFMHWLTSMHALRWRAATNTLGEGAVYQGRYKAIPVHTEEYFLALARYVERNALRARLVTQAEDWPWCSLWVREVARDAGQLAPWPVAAPADWIAHVNRPQTASELAAIRRSVIRGCALGNERFQAEMAKTMGFRVNSPKRGPILRNRG